MGTRLLGLIDEMLHCRDDAALHSIQAKIQDVLDRQCIRATSNIRFVERYKSGESFLHIHGIGGFAGGKRINFCISTGGVVNIVPLPWAEMHKLPVTDAGGREIKVSMFVDVRERCEGTEDVTYIPSIVRLNGLDECKCLNGDVRQASGESRLRQWGRFSGVEFVPEGEKAMFEGLGVARITLDEVECEMVESRPQEVGRPPKEEAKEGQLVRCWMARAECWRLRARHAVPLLGKN